MEESIFVEKRNCVSEGQADFKRLSYRRLQVQKLSFIGK
jgi:hypothetical protein